MENSGTTTEEWCWTAFLCLLFLTSLISFNLPIYSTTAQIYILVNALQTLRVFACAGELMWGRFRKWPWVAGADNSRKKSWKFPERLYPRKKLGEQIPDMEPLESSFTCLKTIIPIQKFAPAAVSQSRRPLHHHNMPRPTGWTCLLSDVEHTAPGRRKTPQSHR